jgi:hypothetical protein
MIKKKIYMIDEAESQRSVYLRISEIGRMPLADLRQLWIDMFGEPVPQVSAGVLSLALAYEVQIQAFGGLSRATLCRLDMLASHGRVSLPLQPGMRLLREWKGKLHIVTVDDAGHPIWDGRQWRSLSEIARAITGTRWSGPAFFGLIERVRAA